MGKHIWAWTGFIAKITGDLATSEYDTKADEGPMSTEARTTRNAPNYNKTTTNISESKLSVDFNNMPANTTTKKSGDFTGITLDTGMNK